MEKLADLKERNLTISGTTRKTSTPWRDSLACRKKNWLKLTEPFILLTASTLHARQSTRSSGLKVLRRVLNTN